MAKIDTNSSYSTTNNYITITYTSDENLTDIKLTKDGTTFITANSFNNSNATFDVSSWPNGTYNNCYLKGTYTPGSGGTTDVYYTITNNLTYATNSSSVSSIIQNGSYYAVITANSGYILNSATVTMGGVNVTSTVYNNGYISIPKVTGNVVITVVAVAAGSTDTYYTITNNLYNATNSNTTTSVKKGSSYKTTITVNAGYDLNFITVTMNGVDITNSAVNNNVINITSITGNVVITVSTNATQTLTISPILNISIAKNQSFTITYTTNKAVNTHFISFNGGVSYVNNTSGVTSSGNTHTYTYNTTGMSVGTYQMAVRARTASGELAASNIFTLEITETAQVLTVSQVADITEPERTEFEIRYTTNMPVVQHLVSWDGGNVYYDKTTDVTSNGNSHVFKHDNQGTAGTYKMAIRVVAADGQLVATNIFNVTLVNALTFVQYKRLNDGVITDTTDGTFYSTINKYSITEGETYELVLNSANYVCICYYNSSGDYVSYTEGNTSDWSVKQLNQTFTVPDGVTSILICATGSASTQITATLTKKTTSGLLDTNGAYIVDDFSSNSISSNKWNYELGYVRNNETQRYTNTNAEVTNGILALKGRKDSSGNWTSSSIISHGHFAFQYGKIEARVKVDSTWGSFGAFWTLGDSFEFGYHEWSSPDVLGEWWAYCGEFDVMEFYSGNLTCGVFFNQNEEAGRVWYNNYTASDWHTYAMEWNTDGSLVFSIDGNVLSRTSATTNRAFHIPHYILLNQAIGASGGTPASGTSEITQYVDWVKYYPLSTNDVVLNSSSFSISATDFNDNNCVMRPIFYDNCINKSLTWQSSDPSKVTVHAGFCCTTGSSVNGDVIITAMSQSGKTASCRLTAVNGKLT